VDFSSLSSTLECASPYITINDNSGNYGSVPVDSTKENTSDPFIITASGSTPYNTEVDFSLILQDGGYIDTLDFQMIIGLSAPTDTGYYYAYYTGGLHAYTPVYNWIAIDSTQTTYPGTSLDLGDNQVAQIALPFTFTYYGVAYDTITICSEGWIAMGYQTAYDQSNTPIPSPDGPNAMIAPLWDDMDPGNAGAPSDIYYYYESNNHIFVIEYFQIEHWPSGNYETFEIILYDPQYYWTPTGDGEIIFQYLETWKEADITIGIENWAETIGIQYFLNGTYDPLAGPITNQFAIRFTTIPPGGVVALEEHKTSVSQNYHNVFPTVSRTGLYTIYYIPEDQRTTVIKIFDAAGRLRSSDHYQYHKFRNTFPLDLSDATPGIYFVEINGALTQKIIKVR
jgi:hypothetical protein